jgi:hypothetical protein
LKQSLAFIVIKTKVFGDSVHLKKADQSNKHLYSCSIGLTAIKIFIKSVQLFEWTLSPKVFVFMTMKVTDRFKEIDLGPVS